MGRPLVSSPELQAALRDVEGGLSPEDAATKHGVAARTVRRRLEGRAPTPPPLSERRNPPFHLITKILANRHFAALAELQEGLEVHASGGDQALEGWLAQPRPELGEDTLAECRSLLGIVKERAATAPAQRFASLVEKANQLIGRIEQIEARRPKPPRLDVVVEELRRLDGEAIAQIEQHLVDKIEPSEVAELGQADTA
ncbi:MAG TPA: hypothetical protein VI589_11750 [Vicinamibacteria bacterium]